MTVDKTVSGGDLFRMSVRLINRYNAVSRQRRDYGTGVPLSVSELHVVEAIGLVGTTTATQAARIMGVTKGAVSQMLPRLEAKGVVERRPSATDGRAADVSLTALGQIAFQNHAAVHDELRSVFEQSAASMTEQSRADAATLIEAIEMFLDGLLDEGKESR